MHVQLQLNSIDNTTERVYWCRSTYKMLLRRSCKYVM